MVHPIQDSFEDVPRDAEAAFLSGTVLLYFTVRRQWIQQSVLTV